MARQHDLRDQRDEARLRVRHELGDILLRVEAAVRLAIEAPLGRGAVGRSDERLAAPGAPFREAWVLPDGDPPALVVGQVPLQPVELMEREEVDELLHELLRHEVTRDVQVHAAPAEARVVLDRDSRNRPRRRPYLALSYVPPRPPLPPPLNPIEPPPPPKLPHPPAHPPS